MADSTPPITRINAQGDDPMLALVTDLLERMNAQEREYVGLTNPDDSVEAAETFDDLTQPPESLYGYVIEDDSTYTNVGGAWVAGGTIPYPTATGGGGSGLGTVGPQGPTGPTGPAGADGAPGPPGDGSVNANVFHVDDYGSLAAASAAAHADPDGGTVMLARGSETITSTVTISKPTVSVQGYGEFVSTLTAGASLNGPVIRWRMAPFTVQNAGKVAGFNIVGNSQANGCGVEVGDIVGAELSGIFVAGFVGTSGRGIWWNNTTDWTERGRFIDLGTLNNTINQDVSTNGGTDSFGYNRWENCRHNVDAVEPGDTPRVGFRVGAGCTLYHCYIEMTQNIGGDQGGVETVVPTGTQINGTVTASDVYLYGEQGVGTGAVGLEVASGGELVINGMIAMSAGDLTNTVDGRLAGMGWCDLNTPVQYATGVTHPSGEDSKSFRIGRETVEAGIPEFNFNQLSTDTELIISGYDGTTFKNFLLLDYAEHLMTARSRMIAQQQFIVRQGDVTSVAAPEFRFSLEEDPEQMFLYTSDGAGGFINFLKLRADNQRIEIYPTTQFSQPVQIDGGSFLFSGAGAPNVVDGSNGDWYFRTDGNAVDGRLYVKDAGAWVRADNQLDVGVADNRLIRSDGTSGELVQGSGISLSDSDDLIDVRNLYAERVFLSNQLYLDEAYENTVDEGVTVDGVLIKDGLVDGVDVAALVEGTNELFLGAEQWSRQTGSPLAQVLSSGRQVWFLDDASNEGVSLSFVLPTSWGSCDVYAWMFQQDGGTGNVVVGLRYGDLEPGDSVAAALTNSLTTFAVGSNNITTEVAMPDPLAPTPGAAMTLVLHRAASDGGDNYLSDVGFLGLRLVRTS